MKILKMLGIIAFWCSLFVLPSFFVEDISLAAEQAIRGHDIHGATSARSYWDRNSRTRRYTTDTRVSIYGHPGYEYSTYRTYNMQGNILQVKNIHSTPTGHTSALFVDLDDLTLNQALPDPPDVNLNISQSSDSKKALVRWNID